MRSCSNIAGIYMIFWCNISEKNALSQSPALQNRGLWEFAFCTPLYTFSVLTYALTGKKKNKWQDSTLCILPLGHEKTQLSASFPWSLKKPKKTKKKQKKQNKKTQKKPRSSNYEPPNLSLESLFSVFFVFFGFQLWSLILCREFCSWGLPVGDAMLKWQVQPYFFFLDG